MKTEKQKYNGESEIIGAVRVLNYDRELHKAHDEHMKKYVSTDLKTYKEMAIAKANLI